MCLIQPPDLPDPPPPAPEPAEEAASAPESGLKIRKRERAGERSPNLTIPRPSININ